MVSNDYGEYDVINIMVVYYRMGRLYSFMINVYS